MWSRAVQLLRAGVKAVPAVKYAGGVAGVMAAFALGTALFRSPLAAVLGALTMLVLMVLLLVFAAAASLGGSAFRLPALVMTWAILLLFLVSATLTVSAVFFDKPKPFPQLLTTLWPGGTSNSGGPPPPPRDQVQAVQAELVSVDVKEADDRTTSLKSLWTDITWLGTQGWLAGAIEWGGGQGQYLGRGVLLYTENGGVSWKEITRDKFDSGQGTLTAFGQRWDNVGPITRIWVYKRMLSAGTSRLEGWLASVTGVYFAENADNVSAAWRRVSPSPDQPGGYSQFLDMASIEAFREIYVVGWQGIAHWSRGGEWQVQKPAYTYPITALAVTGDDERVAWAVGRAGEDELGHRGSNSHAAIYRLEWPGATWAPVPLPGIAFDGAPLLYDVAQVDSKTVVAVGDGGLVIRGSRDDQGGWTWRQVPSQTKEGLKSLAYDGGRLWAVGLRGALLTSDDGGASWARRQLMQSGNGPVTTDLTRVRVFDNTIWVLGPGVVIKAPRT